jgi:hypothetical protein
MSTVPPLVEHKRLPPRTHSFGSDEEARIQAKRETNRAYRERNKARVLAKQREWREKGKKKTEKGLDTHQ